MILTEKRKFDQKNRLYIPLEYIRAAGGDPNGEVYVQFDEQTKEIRVVFPKTPKKQLSPALAALEKLGGGIAR